VIIVICVINNNNQSSVSVCQSLSVCLSVRARRASRRSLEALPADAPATRGLEGRYAITPRYAATRTLSRSHGSRVGTAARAVAPRRQRRAITVTPSLSALRDDVRVTMGNVTAARAPSLAAWAPSHRHRVTSARALTPRPPPTAPTVGTKRRWRRAAGGRVATAADAPAAAAVRARVRASSLRRGGAVTRHICHPSPVTYHLSAVTCE
jgi:hypothetical protein